MSFDHHSKEPTVILTNLGAIFVSLELIYKPFNLADYLDVAGRRREDVEA